MSKIDKLKEQHPELNVSIIDLLTKIDPSDTNKYIEFLIKQLKNSYDYDEDITNLSLHLITEIVGVENVTTLNEFDIHCKSNRVKKNDISQYKTWSEMEKSVSIADEIVRQKELEKQVVKLMDNDEYCVLIPLSYEASKIYGANTKWCTTQEPHWNNYIINYKLVYIMDKVKNDKYAVSIKANDKDRIQAWLSDDKEVHILNLPVSVEVINLIVKEVNKDEPIIKMEEYSKVNNVITTHPKKSDTYNVWAPSVQSLINEYIRNIDGNHRYYHDNDNNITFDNDNNTFDYRRFR